MFVDPGQSPYDLNFSLFGIRVRVSPWFWLVSAFFVWDSVEAGFSYLFMGIGCIFISILVHELGHVLAGRLFGADGYIVLYGFGGLAVGSNNLSRRWQRIAVSFAGPLAQFMVLGVLILGLWQGWIPPMRELSGLPRFAFAVMFSINLYWPLLNLLPVCPLDGGMISREVLEGFSPNRGLRWSLGLSVACAGLLAVNSLLVVMRQKPIIPYFAGGTWTLILFGMLAVSSYQMLQQLGPPSGPRSERERGERAEWERDPDYWK